MKKTIKALYIKYFKPDFLKLKELKILKEQHQHFETLESIHDRYCQITLFGHSQNIVRSIKIASLEMELSL